MLVRYYRFFDREDYSAAHLADTGLQLLLAESAGRLMAVPHQLPGYDRQLRTIVFGARPWHDKATIHMLQFLHTTRLISVVLDVNLVMLGPLQTCFELHQFTAGLIGEVPPDLAPAMTRLSGFQDLVVTGAEQTFVVSISSSSAGPASGTAISQVG